MASSFNGIGRTYYGQRDFESDGSFITTKWLIILFLPIVPSNSYRVKILSSGGPFYQELEVIEELSICWRQVLFTFAYVYGLIPLALFFPDKLHWEDMAQILTMLAVVVLPFTLRFFAKKIFKLE